MDQVASNVADYVSAQQSVAAALPAAGTAWLDSSRDQARTTLAAVGLPSTRQEDWKYTNIKPITRSLFRPVSRPSRWNDQAFVADAQVSGRDSHRLVFADGILVPELSQCDGLPAGVTVAGMADILQRDAGRAEETLGSTLPGLPHGFSAMNSSFIPDGAFVEIGPGIVLEKPIELLFVSACEGEGRLGLPRNLIVCRSGSRASVIERYLSAVEARSLTNAVSEVILDDGARLTHQRIIDESSRSFHVGGLFARLNRDSRLDACSVTLGGALVTRLGAIPVIVAGFALAVPLALAFGLSGGSAWLAIALIASLGLVQGSSFAAVPELNPTPEARAEHERVSDTKTLPNNSRSPYRAEPTAYRISIRPNGTFTVMLWPPRIKAVSTDVPVPLSTSLMK